MSEPVLKVIQDVLLPLVTADGGELYLVRAADDEVQLHLAGRFAGCPGNTLATRRVIEPLIHKAAPNARVSVTSGAIIPKNAQRL
ncbi:MAG: NifU family protein [Polyangiaceae bacterium]|nr:NifU family protein [Myxococcales bacterium]MCB9590363.1 NifU family protein [Polyangiaceae bacterium]MCB9604982.1 NifU family protein [Polyangiaceae bacterium]